MARDELGKDNHQGQKTYNKCSTLLLVCVRKEEHCFYDLDPSVCVYIDAFVVCRTEKRIRDHVSKMGGGEAKLTRQLVQRVRQRSLLLRQRRD